MIIGDSFFINGKFKGINGDSWGFKQETMGINGDSCGKANAIVTIPTR